MKIDINKQSLKSKLETALGNKLGKSGSGGSSKSGSAGSVLGGSEIEYMKEITQNTYIDELKKCIYLNMDEPGLRCSVGITDFKITMRDDCKVISKKQNKKKQYVTLSVTLRLEDTRGLSRESMLVFDGLYDDPEDRIANIIDLFDTGYFARARVAGIWKGNYAISRQYREPENIYSRACEMFNSTHDKSVRLELVDSDDIKTYTM